jgi:hypothetical protein
MTTYYADAEQTIYNKGYYLEFYHIPSGKSVKFKAMITDFDDKYASSWKDKNVYGRSDPIVSYECTKREISLSWDVAAASLEEAKTNLEKSSLLLSMLYPAYSGGDSANASTIASSPLFRLKFANLIQNVGGNKKIGEALGSALGSLAGAAISLVTGQQETSALSSGTSGASSVSGLVGKMSGLSYKPVMDEGFFDLSGGILYPQAIKFSCTYTVLHTHALGFSENGQPRSGFANLPYGTKYTAKTASSVKNSSSGGTRQINSAKQKKMEGK